MSSAVETGGPSVLDAILSPYFFELLNTFERGIPQRIKILCKSAEIFYSDYQASRRLESLNHAVAFNWAILDELPATHEDATSHAATLVSMLKEKASTTRDLASIDKCLRGVQRKAQITQHKGGNVFKEALQELGAWYFTRFEFGEHEGDLTAAIEILEGYVATHDTVLSLTMWALGGALYHRSLSTGSVEDLDRSIHLHETVLKSWQPDHPKRSQALRFLARTCYMKWRAQEDDPSRAGFVLAAEPALVESPNFPEKTSLLECLNAIRTAEELIKGATDLHNFIMKSGALEIIDRLTEQQEAVEKYKIEAQAFESTSSAPDPVESQIYKGLEKGQKSIRILELLPGLPGQKVFCQMFTVLLSKNTKYEVSPKTSSIPRTRQNLTFSKALSYAWGDPRETFEIFVNGDALEVRKNLYLALHRLRKQDSSRPLWVDAVCINQKDLHEKSEQVARGR
jgi:hypothetical protein